MEETRYKYEDFLHLTLTSLQDFLALRGLSTSGNKAVLVARAFGAYELNAPVKFTQEQISKELKGEYKRRLDTNNAPDPNKISSELWKDDVLSWPDLDEGNLFSFILKNKVVETECIGKYKDQKAYSFYESGFVGCLYSYQVPESNMTFIKGTVTPSTKVRDSPHEVWILFHKQTKGGSEITTTWCTCIAGTSRCCNHIIATMHKLNYAYKKGYVNPLCTSVPEGWNRGTQQEIRPMRILELFTRNDSCKKKPKDKRSPINSEVKQKFDPRHPEQRKLTHERVSELFQGIKHCLPNACVLYSVADSMSPMMPLPLPEAATLFMSQTGQYEKKESELAAPILEFTQLTEAQKQKIEETTRDQTACSEWKNQRRGRITASVVHEVMTKTDAIITNRRKGCSPKYTLLVDRIINGGQEINNEAIQWGKQHEKDAIQTFMAQEAHKHDGGLNNVRQCGLSVKADEPFLGASPDGLFCCKCCGTAVLECKCPFSIRNTEIKESYKSVDFLEMISGSLKLKKSHKYYSQITMQMAIKGATHSYFIVWTLKDFHVERIGMDRQKWIKLQSNALFFFKSYVMPVLLGKKVPCCCPNCSKVVLESDEVQSPSEQSVCCDDCNTWWHWNCAKITSEKQVSGTFICPSCIWDMVQARAEDIANNR